MGGSRDTTCEGDGDVSHIKSFRPAATAGAGSKDFATMGAHRAQGNGCDYGEFRIRMQAFFAISSISLELPGPGRQTSGGVALNNCHNVTCNRRFPDGRLGMRAARAAATPP
jgi:hypothetical protein